MIDTGAPHPDKIGTMASQPPTKVYQFGHERQPVVVIDGFSGRPDELLARARAAEYREGGASYPGIRSWAAPDYLDLRRDLLFAILQRVFGFRKGIELEASTFSMVTKRPEELSAVQRIPHYDHAGGELIAIMHYLLDDSRGGTAFYRHRRTGFETITPAREGQYSSALKADEAEFGMPESGYHYGDSDRYEMIGEVRSKPDRFVLYRGCQLHSGVIPDPAVLTDDPQSGRVTINMFMLGA